LFGKIFGNGNRKSLGKRVSFLQYKEGKLKLETEIPPKEEED